MSIYKYLIESVRQNKSFRIDLIKKNLKIGHKQIMKGGIVHDDFKEMYVICANDLEDFLEYAPVLNESCWNVAEHLYEKYKHSTIKQTIIGNNSYFKANKMENLSDYDLAYGLDRNVAQAILEGYILLAGLSGWLKIDEDHWFYQGKDKDFVVLKEWI